MTNEQISKIIEKCDFYYDGNLLSKESIIKDYFEFLSHQFKSHEKNVGFSFHLGNDCYSAVSVAALMIGVLTSVSPLPKKELTDVVTDGDEVFLNGEKYRWRGIEQTPLPPYEWLKLEPINKCEKDEKVISYGKNRKNIWPNKEKNYKREDFISHVSGISRVNIPAVVDFSIIVVDERSHFSEICNRLSIVYDGNKTVKVCDVFTILDYSRDGAVVGKNKWNLGPVIKVAGNLSVARKLLFEPRSNNVGLVVLNINYSRDDPTEVNRLEEFISRKELRFILVSTRIKLDLCKCMVDRYPTASFFACTQALLNCDDRKVKAQSEITSDLFRLINNIYVQKITPVILENFDEVNLSDKIRKELLSLRNNKLSFDGNKFIPLAYSLLKLFTTSFLTMKQMNECLASDEFRVDPPELKVRELVKLAEDNEQFLSVSEDISRMYSFFSECSPKKDKLIEILESHKKERIALVVPRLYYKDLYNKYFSGLYDNVECVFENQFDARKAYDIVICLGCYPGKIFDCLQCLSSPKILILLYDFEYKILLSRIKKLSSMEQCLNEKILGERTDRYQFQLDIVNNFKDDNICDSSENTTAENEDFTILEDLIKPSIDNVINSVSEDGVNKDVNTFEVGFFGRFSSGEIILFSKNYKATVIDELEGVKEKAVKELKEGDVLIFAKRDSFTRNVVDSIMEHFNNTGKLNSKIKDAYQKSLHWRKVLRKFRKNRCASTDHLMRVLRKNGISITNEATLRNWLSEDGTVVGPQKERDMNVIARVTGDHDLVNDVKGYFDACKLIRHERGQILKQITLTVREQPGAVQQDFDDELSFVSEYIKHFSERLELEFIDELKEIKMVDKKRVNLPLFESEVII
ncbi:DrmE family protein [Ruminobacter amylophilus]|uniref:DrmE family protein n=1 Tax=Ruminobacter amylophilus TaxID=867 RepID=UPI00387056C9